MFRREALWISLSRVGGSNPPAVKVSVGGENLHPPCFLSTILTDCYATGVNVISGASTSDLPPLKNGPQDYIIPTVLGCRIDGISSGPGFVRQVYSYFPTHFQGWFPT